MFLVAVCYVVAVLILLQFAFVRFVLSSYGDPISGSSRQAKAPVIIQKKTAQGQSPTALGLPVRLKIPSIKVNAVIHPVGLMPDGSMGVPKSPRDTAWYMFGPKPGQKGSAVIAGHVNWLYGATGVFERLKNLKQGDTIIVQDDRGINTSFVVRESRAYEKSQNAADVFRSYDGSSHLNLITCGGIWDKISKSYSKRLVVFADKKMR